MNKNRDKKVELVGQFEEKIKKAKALVLADYRGLTHQQLETLKKNLKQVEAELVITKNTLLKRAMSTVYSLQSTAAVDGSRNAVDESTDALQGPTATLFAYNDIIAPLKELAKTIKTLKLPTIKFGLLEGKTLTGEEVLRLSALPSREILLAQVIGGMKSPIYGLHRALSWNVQKLVMTLRAIEEKKS